MVSAGKINVCQFTMWCHAEEQPASVPQAQGVDVGLRRQCDG